MAVNATASSRTPVAGAARWAHENLFSSVANSVLTVGSIALMAFLVYQVGRFVLVSADWQVVETNRRLFFIGRFPDAELWRVWVIVYMVSGLAGVTLGLWSRLPWLAWPVLGLALVPVFLFIGGGEVALLTAGSVALFTLAYLAARTWAVRGRSLSLARNIALVSWLLSFAVTMYLLSAVDSRLWGGLLLTMILAVVGIVASFPFGVLLALGRASTFPVIRIFCTVYIEVMRGVPLVIVLFMAFFFLPLMLEADRSMLGLPVTGIDLDVVQRAMIALTMFSAAYVAEIVRGGLQIVPRGQVEAAEALGLGTARILGLIVLPQALRAVIPALVGQFISLFKDTSLVLIMGLTELLAAARIVTAQQDFIGKQAESLLFVALIYWLIAFSMSRASQRLEQTLGVGER
ncbi:MAG: amino acid ABC transporter permease [Chloroflexi bacterium]|nr:amino acid ABC transporter permease [Chloroflexota bacterium]